MKKFAIISFLFFFTIGAFAQSPETFSYQAVVRDAAGVALVSQPVGVQISILQGTLPGTEVYVETFSISTNGFGLINLSVGSGTVQNGSISGIDWSNGPYHLNVAIDITGGTSYTDMGTVQLLSVPYALYAKTAGNSFSGDYNDLSNKPTLGGDVTGNIEANTVAKIQGKDVSNNLPANGQVLKWNNTSQAWEPADDQLGAAGTTDGVVTGATVTGTTTKTLTLIRSNGLGDITAVFTDEVGDADADPTNEIQSLTMSGNNLSISGGNTVAIPQNTYTAGSGISVSGNQIINIAPDQAITLTGNGSTNISGTYPNFIITSSDNNTTYSSGTGINITGTTINNTSPDQTVVLQPGSGINVTGTYPTFNISNSNPDQTVTLTNGAGITITGTYPNFTIVNNQPDQNVTLTGTGATSVTGTYPNFTVTSTDNNTTYSAGTGIGMTGTTINNTAPDQTVTLTGNGATSVTGTYPNFTINSTDNNTTYTAGTGMTLTGTTFDAQTTSPLWNANQIQGIGVLTTLPSNGQVLKFNGTSWAPAADNSNNYLAGTGLALAGSTFSHSAHTGDATGSTALTVTGIQGRTVSTNIPANGQVLKWNSTSLKWEPNDDALGAAGTNDGVVTGASVTGTSTKTLTLTRSEGLGDITATFNDAGTVYTPGTGIGIAGTTINNTAPDQTVTITGAGSNSVSGTYPNFTITGADNNTTYTAGTGMTLTGTVFSAQTSTALWNANQIQGVGVLTTLPVNGQVMKFNGTSWAPAADNNTTYTAGAGLSLTGTTFANTAPDQTVTLTGVGSTAVTGAYPNFTITGTDNNTTYTAGTGLSLTGTTFSSTQNLTQTLANGNSAGTYSINMNSQNITGANILGLRTNNLAYIDMYWGHIYDYYGSHGVDGQVLRVHGTSPSTYVTWDNPSSLFTAGTGLSISGNTLNTVWAENGTHIYNNNTGNVGVGINVPNARLTVKGNSASTATEPLFEIKNRVGQTVFVVYEDSVRIYVDDDPAKSNKGTFAVSGRNSAKAFTNNFLLVTPDSSRVFTGDQAAGFGVRNINGSNKESYMHINPNNIFIGHQAGHSNTSGLYNSFIGYYSGYANTIGLQNTANGYMSMRNNISGNYSTAVGAYALYSNTTGIDNTAIGNNCMSATTIGSKNVAIGSSAMQDNVDGIGNAAVGVSALRMSVDGSYNAALGYWAGRNATTGSNNVFVGYSAGYASTGSYNAIIGYQSGYNTSGNFNAFVGYQSGYTNTTGYNNSTLGYQSLFSNTTGYYNVAIGAYALYANTDGYSLTAVGNYALNDNTSGIDNTALGNNCLSANTTGQKNVAVGSSALQDNIIGSYNTSVGVSCLRQNTGSNNTAMGWWAGRNGTSGSDNTYFGYSSGLSTTGSYNTFIGDRTGYSNTTGANNTALGYYAFYSGAAYSNSTAIGYNAAITASNRVAIGNTSVSWIGGQVTWSTYSDSRFKKNVAEDVPGLEFITQLRPVTYNFDMDVMARFFNTPDSLRLFDAEAEKSKVKFSGFLAQEVEATAQKLGYDFSGVCKPQNDKDFYSLRYAEFTVPLVKSVQELNQKIETLTSEKQAQEVLINQLLQRVTELEQKMDSK